MMSRNSSNAGRALWWWVGSGFAGAGAILAVATILGFVAAVLGASLSCKAAEPSGPVATNGPVPSAAALQDIPPERLRIYEQAGARFDLDWTFLASIGAQECNHDGCAGVNSAGCAGPMQISYQRESPCSPGPGPTLWERYEVSAHPGQQPSVNDPADAVFTAARILRQDMGAPPIGGSYAEYRQAACRYYGACADTAVSYADEVMARSVQYGFTSTGTPAPTSTELAQPVEAASQSGCAAAPTTPAGQAGIVQVAESQLGQAEHPPGSNCTIYGPCEEWCSLFVAWVWQHAGIPLTGPTAVYAYSGSLYTWVAEHHGHVLPSTARPAPGDAVFYGTGPSDSLHVGIVTSILANGQITTIDGNYANKVSRVGQFDPAHAAAAGEPGPVYGYAQPPANGAVGG
jgi:hypothetical protein